MARGLENLKIDDKEEGWINDGDGIPQQSAYDLYLIFDLGDQRYLFKIFHNMEIEHVENETPWTFNNHLLILHRLKENEDPLLVPLVFTNFWVQVHDLPPGFFSEKMAKQFGNFIGTVIDYDMKDTTTMESYVEGAVKKGVHGEKCLVAGTMSDFGRG
ncbi:hypothetical protein Goarm_010149 [Gossypium armourianum]|uniref:DUF4283 domain-containing protein n=1 Tax=Gossypium armourianum TaxID=34283 RepID=A0A7J9JV50_9ROSI|nr:hypothetical protein [Gossypium armourianum]